MIVTPRRPYVTYATSTLGSGLLFWELLGYSKLRWRVPVQNRSYQFAPARFLQDVEVTAGAIGAPYSRPITQAVLDAYAENFRESAVLWRTTDRPGGALNYRFYERRPTDTLGVAIEAGLLAAGNELIPLISSWRSLYGATPTELCDFDAGLGFAKTWLYLGGMRPVDDVLGAPGVPESIRGHGPTFHALGLVRVRHVAVDYQHNSVNIYFRAPGPITLDQCQRFVSLADGEMPDHDTFGEMKRFAAPAGCTFSVTMTVGDGRIQRVGFYALKLPQGEFPTIGERLSTFFKVAPSRDEEEMNAVAWSFGSGGGTYVKAERSYCGRLVALMKEWSSPMTAVDAQGVRSC
jgi:4-hydroxyphenylpyruvate 3-dimethylallyltransferase